MMAFEVSPDRRTGTDCNAIAVNLTPVGDPPLPTCEILGDIPVVTWEGEGYHASVRLSLGNVDDPVEYLGRLGRQLLAFAAQVAHERNERQPRAAS